MEKTSVKVFIASASDVAHEREKTALLLTQLNKSHKHLHLEPVMWEYDMVKGGYPGYDSIQDAINDKLSESHLILFIFYTKIGANTRVEFELAQKTNKKILVLFREGFSPKKEHLAAYGELLDFKDGLNDILKIYYKDITEFENRLYENMNLHFSENYSIADVGSKNESLIILSQNNQQLIQALFDKEQKIAELEGQLALKNNSAGEDELQKLREEKEVITLQLQQSEEISKQHESEKKALEAQLSLQKESDQLKQMALDAVKEKNYEQAEQYLMQSAKDSAMQTAATFYELAKIKKLQFKYSDAFGCYELAAKIDPQNSLYHHESGAMALYLGLNKKAIDSLETALAIDLTLHDEENPDIAAKYNDLGLAHKRKGEYDKAIQLYEKALSIDLKFHNEEHPSIAIRYNNLGSVYDIKGEYDKAIQLYEKALAIKLRFHGEEHPNIATSYNNLGSAYYHKGEYDKAIQLFEKALAIDLKFHGEEYPDIAIAYNNLGLAYDHKGEYDKAIQLYEKALAINLKFHGEEYPDIAIAYNNLGLAYDHKGEYDKAIQLYQKALTINLKFHGEEHPDIAASYNNLGSVYDSKGEYDKAIQLFEKALAISLKFHGEEHPDIATRYNNLGFAYESKAEYDKAIQLYEKARLILSKFVPTTHPNMLALQENLYIAQEKKDQQNK